MNRNKKVSLLFPCALCLTIVLAWFFAPGISAQTPDEELEREAQAIDRMIMCPVCPAETIDQAQVEISFQMRAVIREMLSEGSTREEILDYFVDRYGPDILAAPPKSGANLLAWILPIVGVAAGLVALYLVVRAMTGNGKVPSSSEGASSERASRWGRFPGQSRSLSQANVSASEPQTTLPEDPDMSAYLEIVDRSLASRRGMRPGPGQHPRPASPPEVEGISASETDNNG